MSNGKKPKKKRARKTPVAGAPKKRASEPVIERPSEPVIAEPGEAERPSEPVIAADAERVSDPAIVTTKFERAPSPGVVETTTKFERASGAPESVSAPVVAPDAVPLGKQPAQSGRSRPATMPPPLPVGKPAPAKPEPAAKSDPAAKSEPATKPTASAPAPRPGRYRPPTMPPPVPPEALRPREPQVSLVDRLLGRLLRRKPAPAPILPAAWTTPAPTPTVKIPSSSDTTLSPQDIVEEAELSGDRTPEPSGTLVEKLSAVTPTPAEPSASSSETSLSTQDILLEDVRAALEASGRADAVAPATDDPASAASTDKAIAATPADKPVAAPAAATDVEPAAAATVAEPTPEAVAEPVAELPVAPIISWTDQSQRQKPSTTPPLETSGERTKSPTAPPANAAGERSKSPSSPPESARAKSPTAPPEEQRTKTPTAPPADAAREAGERTKAPTSPPDGASQTAPPEAVSRAERTKEPSAPPADEPAPHYPRAETVRAPDNLSLSPEWPLDTSEAEGAVVPPPPESVPSSMMPDPKAAALEAARIVGEIVGDIESAGGAAIVAAAAAGAAIEAARARNRAVAEGELVPTSSTEAGPTGDASGNDPVVTVRMQRDRILRALAEDVAAQAEAQANQESAQASEAASARSASQPGRAVTQPGVRSSSQVIPRPAKIEQSADATQGEGDDEVDPVQIASAAIQRFRQRAKTDLAELKGHYHRHDVFVLMFALVIIVIAGRVHRGMVTPPTTKFSKNGLVFEHSQAWLGAEPVPTPAPRIAHELAGQPVKSSNVYHVEFSSTLGTDAKIEVLIDKKPTWSNIVTGLELDRRTRWGELYTLDDSSVRSIAEHDWLRTAYRYAHVSHKGDVPRVDSAVEYATIDREQIYVVTLFGTDKEIERLEEVVAPSLRVPTRTGLPLVPQTRMLSQRTYPNAVARAFDSTVMVVVADLVDGRLRPRGGGSGVVVGSDGSILTNYHVVHDKNGRLHDVFVIGRFSKPDHAPQLWCAGRPSRSKLQRDLDLALIKCDLDLDGRTWNPTSGSIWATLPEGRSVDVKMGQRLWVLGYPDVGGGGLTLSEGEVDGWTGTNNTAGKDFIKTNASITHGNSGGPVVDDQGRLVGVASAFRTRVTIGGDVTESKETGLVRPLSTASCLLAIAAVGWTPREGHSDCELQPSAVEAPADGIRISTKIVDAANEVAVVDALVMILRPGVSASAVDVNRLDDQVLSWGRSNTQGDVQLKQPVPAPGTYTVMVVARGYEPLIGESELRLDANTPPNFDPWGKIWLRSR